MKRLLLSLTLLCSLSCSLLAFDWSKIAPSLQESTKALVARTTDGEERVYCSSFSIDDRRQYFITANHCIIPDPDQTMLMEGYKVVVLKQFADLDVAILWGAFGVPPLHPGKGVVQGQEVAAYGYAYGWTQPSLIAQNVAVASLRGVEVEDDEADSLYVLTAHDSIGGMSGGPVVNTNGQVVSMVQRGNGVLALTRSWADIMKATKSYWRFTK